MVGRGELTRSGTLFARDNQGRQRPISNQQATREGTSESVSHSQDPLSRADEPLCLCFSVSWRKVVNYARLHRIRQASRLSECQGAGTGCGWCRPWLRRIAEQVQADPPSAEQLELWLAKLAPPQAEYRSGRQAFREHPENRA
jgi:bacterioferritin-associated ferredoxin